MSRLTSVFQNGKAFIPFITAGDPSLEITERLIPAMAQAGADLIELGLPFSDPVAEGEVIQGANMRALAQGVNVDRVFALVERVRQACQVPLALMTYANPVFVYGPEKFMTRCAQVGVDALIVPDVPFEERDEFLPYCRAHGIALISMVAPTSGDRMKMIAQEAEGFVYCVSSLGVTGVREKLGDQVAGMVEMIKGVKDIPCAVGFGIATPQQAREVAGVADGVIVGSAIVQIIAQHGPDCIPHVVNYVREMKEAIR
ncbi:MAG TPA: tryptophan synthase subunit alpha [Clostridia bacterium]|nr:tryptophan synthase subunit alpha [Clostridia bacterium]